MTRTALWRSRFFAKISSLRAAHTLSSPAHTRKALTRLSHLSFLRETALRGQTGQPFSALKNLHAGGLNS